MPGGGAGLKPGGAPGGACGAPGCGAGGAPPGGRGANMLGGAGGPVALGFRCELRRAQHPFLERSVLCSFGWDAESDSDESNFDTVLAQLRPATRPSSDGHHCSREKD